MPLAFPNPGSGYSSPGSAADSGQKQTSVSEIYPAFVTWKTGKPSKMIFTREESQIASSPRHEMEVSVQSGRGQRRQDPGDRCAIPLSNTGAYGEPRPPQRWGLVRATSRSPYMVHWKPRGFSYDVVLYQCHVFSVLTGGTARPRESTQ